MDGHECISKLAEELWHEAGEPTGHDLDFWLRAEKEYHMCLEGRLCILNPGSCPFQKTVATLGGRHVSLCEKEHDCRNRAINYLKEFKHGQRQ